MSINSGLLISTLFLCRIIDIAWCVAMVLILLKICLMASSRILNFSSIVFIEDMCKVA